MRVAKGGPAAGKRRAGRKKPFVRGEATARAEPAAGKRRAGRKKAGAQGPDGGRLVVLIPVLDEEDARAIVEKKKAGAFTRLMVVRPKAELIRVHKIEMFLEAFVLVSAKYSADYYRKASHKVSVGPGVREVVLGGLTFPAKSKSRSISEMFSRGRAKGEVRLGMEEHVFVENRATACLDCHGQDARVPFKLDKAAAEINPESALAAAGGMVRRPEVSAGEALKGLKSRLMPDMGKEQIRDLNDMFEATEAAEVYVPVFEARLVGPRGRIAVMRINGSSKAVM